MARASLDRENPTTEDFTAEPMNWILVKDMRAWGEVHCCLGVHMGPGCPQRGPSVLCMSQCDVTRSGRKVAAFSQGPPQPTFPPRIDPWGSESEWTGSVLRCDVLIPDPWFMIIQELANEVLEKFSAQR